MATLSMLSMLPILSDATANVPKFTFSGSVHSAKVVSCYDGDTFDAVMFIGDKLWKFDCRMSGYDSPEMKPLKTAANREAEKAAALRAKKALLSFICDGVDVLREYTNKELDELVKRNKKLIELQCKEFDKYGRLLVEIPATITAAADAAAATGPTDSKHDPVTSNTVNSWMIVNKFGYEYTGGTKMTFSK
jgi:endonuclease YncB( thermonuclease family)